MRIRLGSDDKMFFILKTLHTILNNILRHPEEIKYQKLKLSNQVVKAAIADVQESRFLLEMLGFQECAMPSNVVYANG